MASVQEALTWIDASGNQFSLNDQGTFYVPDPGMAGHFGLPMSMVSHTIPGLPGDFEQFIQIDPNDVRFPIYIFGDTPDVLEINRRTLLEATRPTRGVATLRHTSQDGVVRDLFCREMGRFRDVAARSPSFYKLGMVLRAADPFWYDANFSSQLLVPGGAVSFFQNPVLPLHLSAGGLSGGFTIENLGQDIAYPKWIITGPGTNPVLTNVTTGLVLTVTITLTAGQVLTIDTNPDTLGVTRENGSDQWSTINSLSSLWPLVVGTNQVTLGMTGTTSASQLQISWKNRWESI